MNVVVAGWGGAGKTTLAGTLARVIAARGPAVLVVEDDPAPTLATTLGVEPADEVAPLPDDLLNRVRPSDDGTVVLILGVYWRLRGLCDHGINDARRHLSRMLRGKEGWKEADNSSMKYRGDKPRGFTVLTARPKTGRGVAGEFNPPRPSQDGSRCRGC